MIDANKKVGIQQIWMPTNCQDVEDASKNDLLPISDTGDIRIALFLVEWLIDAVELLFLKDIVNPGIVARRHIDMPALAKEV